MPKLNKIALIFALEAEASPVIQSLAAKKQIGIFAPLPMNAYVAERNDGSILIVTNGFDKRYKVDCIGTQPAAIATLLAIQQFKLT